MRSTHRSIITAVLIVALAMPAFAASRPSSRAGSIVDAFKRFVIRAMTRISPPVGCPVADTEEPTAPPPPTKTQSGE